MAEIRRFSLESSGAAAGPGKLLAFLRSAIGHPVEIDAAPAARVDTLRLQILVSAARQWDAAAQPLSLVNMGAEFRAGIHRLGFDPAQFESEVNA